MSEHNHSLADRFHNQALPIIVAKTLTAPLEVLKLNMQVNNFPSYLRILSDIATRDGFRMLFAGNFTNTLRYFPHTYVTYKVKPFWDRQIVEKTKYWGFLRHNEHYTHPQPLRQLFAGILTGFCALLVSHPFDVLRTRLSTDMKLEFTHRKYNGLIHCAIKSSIEDNPRKTAMGPFYKGFSMALLAEVPYRGIFFAAYDAIKQLIQNNTSFYERWTAAQMAVAVATILTYPLDTIKRFGMKAGEYDQANMVYFHNKRIWHSVLWILHERGFMAFYRGLSMNLLRTPLSAAVLAHFDYIHNYEQRLKEKEAKADLERRERERVEHEREERQQLERERLERKAIEYIERKEAEEAARLAAEEAEEEEFGEYEEEQEEADERRARNRHPK